MAAPVAAAAVMKMITEMQKQQFERQENAKKLSAQGIAQGFQLQGQSAQTGLAGQQSAFQSLMDSYKHAYLGGR